MKIRITKNHVDALCVLIGVLGMGSLIWPLLTLILENKLGYDATLIAGISFAMSILQFPMLLLGGRLADKRNRKNVIVICDLVTVVCYIICGLIPLSASLDASLVLMLGSYFRSRTF